MQTVRLLPYVACGFVSWYPKGNVFFTTDNYNPFADLKTLLSLSADDVTFKLKGYGSRLVPALASLSITTGTGFTSGAITANDDWNNNHAKAAYYVVSSAPITTVAEFLKAATAGGADAGSVNIAGDTVSETALTSGKYLNILAISDDGTCELFNKVAA